MDWPKGNDLPSAVVVIATVVMIWGGFAYVLIAVAISGLFRPGH